MTRPRLLSAKKYSGKTVVVVVAHPDDADFRFAATAAKLTRAGARVVYLLATNGGTSGTAVLASADLVTARAEEQLRSASIVGIHDVIILPFEDGNVTYSYELRAAIVREIRRLQADVVVTFDPANVLDEDEGVTHPDHLWVGLATVHAVYPGANSSRQYLECGPALEKTPELWLFGTNKPTHRVRINRRTMRLKLSALASHKSQWSGEKRRLCAAKCCAWLDERVHALAQSMQKRSKSGEVWRWVKANATLC